MMTSSRHRVALLFNANKGFDRDVMSGIAGYMRSQEIAWELFVQDDFRCNLDGIENWNGDGIIADFDDPAIAKAVSRSKAKIVAVGGSYHDPNHYPANIPYVATDNAKLVMLAYHHLIESGLRNFAMFSAPVANEQRWACERELAFTHLMRRDGMPAVIHRGVNASVSEWNNGLDDLVQWLRALPKPIGIIAVTDARARQLIQACTVAGLAVSADVSIIGIDNDPMAHVLSQVPLSSVIQGAHKMGGIAARLMYQQLNCQYIDSMRVIVPPAGINAMASCSHQSGRHPQVMRALHFIRQHARRGIKSEQVADYVGMSRSGLDAHFRRELGCSVHDEILRYKLDEAKQYLATGNFKIADVAHRCGFNSVQYLYTVFAREVGCTPRAYQNSVERTRAAGAGRDNNLAEASLS